MFYCNLLKLPSIWNFIIKKFAVLHLASFGSLKYDCIIKATKILIFLPLINGSVTLGLSFLLLIISVIVSSKAINTLFLCFFLSGLYSLIFS